MSKSVKHLLCFYGCEGPLTPQGVFDKHFLMRQPQVQSPSCTGQPKLMQASRVATKMMLEALAGAQDGIIRQKCFFLLKRHKVSIIKEESVIASKTASKQPLFALPELNPHPVEGPIKCACDKIKGFFHIFYPFPAQNMQGALINWIPWMMPSLFLAIEFFFVFHSLLCNVFLIQSWQHAGQATSLNPFSSFLLSFFKNLFFIKNLGFKFQTLQKKLYYKPELTTLDYIHLHQNIIEHILL